MFCRDKMLPPVRLIVVSDTGSVFLMPSLLRDFVFVAVTTVLYGPVTHSFTDRHRPSVCRCPVFAGPCHRQQHEDQLFLCSPRVRSKATMMLKIVVLLS